MDRAEPIAVEVVYCPSAGQVDQVMLQLVEGATVADALQASGLLQRHGLALEGLRVGVWCKPKELTTPLRERDRVEVYRPLTVDPKEARRQRYQRHKDAAAKRPTPAEPGRPG